MELKRLTRQDDLARLIRSVISGIVFSSIIIFVTLFVPLMGFFMAVILPMPLLYYRLKLGRKPGAVIAMGILSVTAVVTGGPSIDMLFYAAMLMVGFLLGECLENHFSAEKTIGVTVMATTAICSAIFFLYAKSAGDGVMEMATTYVKANLTLTMTLYKEMGMPQENIELLTRSMETIQYVLIRLIPALVITMLTFIAWVNTLSIKRILGRKGITLASLTDLNRWKAPERLVWVIILSGLTLMVPGKGIKILALNTILILMPVYFFQGIAIVSYLFEKRRFPPMLRLFIYSIIAIQQIFILLIVGIGFFDTWIDFRKIGVTAADPEP